MAKPKKNDKDDAWIIEHADELKSQLLELSEAGAPRPEEGTLLGRAIVLFTERDEGREPEASQNGILVLSLPIVNGDCEPSGDVKINGRSAEYRLGYDEIDFRYRDEDVWQKRQILQVTREGELVNLFCS